MCTVEHAEAESETESCIVCVCMFARVYILQGIIVGHYNTPGGHYAITFHIILQPYINFCVQFFVRVIHVLWELILA